MGTPPSPWRSRVHEILADGEWHVLDEVVRDAMRFVPPGKAYRAAEANRLRQYSGPRVRGDETDAIRSGQRQLVTGTLYQGTRTGRLERKRLDGVDMLRDPNASPQMVVSEADDLADELRRQVAYWERAYKLLPKGEMRDVLVGDPIQSIRDCLNRHGRRMP